MNRPMNSVVIIGGGAAGMMAAVSVKEKNPETQVMIFEKNPNLGAKVIISGGGRCNVTTGIHDRKKLLENYPRGATFLKTAIYDFPPEKVMEWFESHGVKLKTEEDLRVFPKSNNGKDVVGAMEKELTEKGTIFHLGKNVTSVVKKITENKQTKFVVTCKDGDTFEFDAVIITTGGNAYRHTGSTGDGYAFAKALGHTITQLGPSLSSFILEESYMREMSGISFERVRLTFIAGESASDPHERTYHRTGAFLFTHKGVTGPAVFALSSLAAYEEITMIKKSTLSINFFPDETPEALKKRIQEAIEKNPKKHLINFLDFFLPKSLCAVFVNLLKIPGTEGVSNLRKEQRIELVHMLQNMNFHIIGRGAGDEFVTAGGVELSEVNPNTMESKICPGLYFAGEILNIDGFTGGFNLQASWATGRIAGKNAALLLHTQKTSV